LILGASCGGAKTSLNRCCVVEVKDRWDKTWVGRTESEAEQIFNQFAREPLSWEFSSFVAARGWRDAAKGLVGYMW